MELLPFIDPTMLLFNVIALLNESMISAMYLYL